MELEKGKSPERFWTVTVVGVSSWARRSRTNPKKRAAAIQGIRLNMYELLAEGSVLIVLPSIEIALRNGYVGSNASEIPVIQLCSCQEMLDVHGEQHAAYGLVVVVI